MRRFVGFCGFRLYEQQSVVELNVRVAELESVERSVVLVVGGAEEVASSGTFDDGLCEYVAAF